MGTPGPRSPRALAAAAIAAVTAGCPSTTMYRSADPVPPGQWHVSAAGGLGGMNDREQETRFPTGHLELGARRGLVEDLDAGLKLYTFGLEASATWRVVRGAKWSFALAPSLSGARTRENAAAVDAIHLFGGAALLATRRLSERFRVSTGPLFGAGLYWPRTGGSARGAWLGGFINGDAFLGERWHLTPELGVYRVVAGEVPVQGGALSLGVAVTWRML